MACLLSLQHSSTSDPHYLIRGQYDDLQGSIDVLWQRQVALKNEWQGL